MSVPSWAGPGAGDLDPAAFAAAVLTSVAEAVVVTDAEGRIVFFNAAAERLYGMAWADVAGRRAVAALAHPEARHAGEGWACRPACDRLLLTRHRRGDGTSFDAEVSFAPVRDAGGPVVGLTGVVRDVTVHRVQQAGAVALRAMLDAAAEAIVGVDAHDVVRFFSPAAELLFGWRAAEAVGASVWTLVGDHPRLQPADVRAVVRAGRVLHRETVVRRPDGRRVAVHLTASPIVAPGGAYEGAVITGLDISARRAALGRFRLDSARMAALVRAAPDAIVTEDRDAGIVTWNPGAERMFGRPAAEAVGRRYDAVALPESERAVYRDLRAQVAAGHTVTMRMAGRRADGSVFPTEVSVAPLRAPDGVHAGAVAIVRDISALIDAELELRERASRLERSNAELEEFAYAASHDLQEPLRSITMGAETVLKAAGDRLHGDERALLGQVGAAATRMSEQVTALMELARVALEDAFAAPVPVQLALDDAVAAMRAAIQDAGAVVEVRGTLPSAAVPRIELTLVLQNLLANAIRYRQPGRRPHVTLSASVGDGDGCVEVRVADNGIGLSEADRPRIFTIFGRADSGVPGTGMGLALCRRILERRSGSITVDSAGPGHGSEFILRLPAGGGGRPA